MHKKMDQVFAYRGYYGCASKCRLRVWEEDGKPPVVLFTELEDNPGTSVTNAIEHIAWEAFKLLERPSLGIIVLEHYRDRGFVGGRALFKEEFDLVTFTRTDKGYEDPVWRRVSKQEAETIIGEPCED